MWSVLQFASFSNLEMDKAIFLTICQSSIFTTISKHNCSLWPGCDYCSMSYSTSFYNQVKLVQKYGTFHCKIPFAWFPHLVCSITQNTFLPVYPLHVCVTFQYGFVCKNCFYLQADTTDTEYREVDGATQQEFMDFLEGPEDRQRAHSIASAITSTMEGIYYTLWYDYISLGIEKINSTSRYFICLLIRTWRVKTEVPPLLVHICPNLPHLGMLSSMAKDQESG